jgi:hypothetical protein
MQHEISPNVIRSEYVFKEIPLKSITNNAVYYHDLCVTFYILTLLCVWNVFSPGPHTENGAILGKVKNQLDATHMKFIWCSLA